MPDTISEALWYVAEGRAALKAEPLEPLASGQARVRTRFSGISRGTERLILSGQVPPEEYDRMRAPFMAGHFPFPVKYGYAAVGDVIDGPPELMGRHVFALHPHQTVFDIPAEALIAVPEGIPSQRAVLAANMETALNAVWDGQPGPADRIAVVGGGVIGVLVAYLCAQIPGAMVTLIDIEPARAPVADALGVRFALPGAATGDCDLVVHASASEAGLITALGLAGNEATVLEMSWYGRATVGAPLGGAFHSRRLKLVSSQVGQIATSRRPRWSYARRLGAAMALLVDARLDALLAPPVAFKDLPSRLPDILLREQGVLCQPVSY